MKPFICACCGTTIRDGPDGSRESACKHHPMYGVSPLISDEFGNDQRAANGAKNESRGSQSCLQ